MALSLPRNVANDCANPALQALIYTNGFMLDPVSLEFQIFDISTSVDRVTPVQVFPVSGREVVDLTDCPTGGRLGLGRFVAVYTPDADEALGTHLVKWFVTKETGGAEETFEQEFEILEAGEPVTDSYVSICDMRKEGVALCIADDERVFLALRLARRFVERLTRRFFEPRYLELKVDGKGGDKILLDIPIIAIESIAIDEFPIEPTSTLLDEDTIKIYNRHIEQGLETPDDRNNPKIEALAFFHSNFRLNAELETFGGHSFRTAFRFPQGDQNITLKGVFGYTENDGSFAGSTPLEIRQVIKLLALRELPGMLDIEAREDFNKRFGIVTEKTKEQTIQYVDRPSGRGQSAFFGYFTGDPNIDNILASFVGPPALGAA